MFRRILAATDLSDPADEAIRQASAWATAEGSRLGVCYVLPELMPNSVLFPQQAIGNAIDVLELERRAYQAVTDRAASITGRAGDGFDVFVEVGSDYAQVVRRAQAWNADLLVVGSHGRSGVSRVLLGSVSEKIVHYAASSVLVARAHGGPECIVVATDLSDASRSALVTGAREAARTGARLVVAHAVDLSARSELLVAGYIFGTPPQPLGADELERFRQVGLAALQVEIDKAGIEKDAAIAGKVTVEKEIVLGSAGAAIATYAEEVGASVVVVGTHGRTGLERLSLGSVAEKIVRLVKCSVLVVRD